jgi:hypothetical protein
VAGKAFDLDVELLALLERAVGFPCGLDVDEDEGIRIQVVDVFRFVVDDAARLLEGTGNLEVATVKNGHRLSPG